jgi:hypothetical protein
LRKKHLHLQKEAPKIRARERQTWHSFRLITGTLEQPAHAEETDGQPAMPWYGRLFIGLCAWVASLFAGLIFLLLFYSSASNVGLPLFLGALLFFPLGYVLNRQKNFFPQQLGLALLFTGAGCLIAALAISLGFENQISLTMLAVFIPSCFLIRNETYRCLGTFLCLFFLPFDMWRFVARLEAGADLRMILIGFLYLSFCLGFAHLWRLRHISPSEGFSVSRQAVLRPFAYGAFAVLLCWGGLIIAGRFHDMDYLISQALFFIGPAAGIALTYSVMHLTKDLELAPAARLGAGLAAIGLAVLSWWLPWAGVSLFALTLARQAGNIPMQGLCIVFLAVSLNIEYYNLESTLLFKSITLCSMGLLFLLAAFGISHLLKKAIHAGHLPDPENIASDTVETPDDPVPPEASVQEPSHA